jgi:hypothetical protein
MIAFHGAFDPAAKKGRLLEIGCRSKSAATKELDRSRDDSENCPSIAGFGCSRYAIRASCGDKRMRVGE